MLCSYYIGFLGLGYELHTEDATGCMSCIKRGIIRGTNVRVAMVHNG